MSTGPRIYVACLASYNAGRLHGAWIEANQDAWGIWGEVAVMLAQSPVPDAEEYIIHDYEGFEGIGLDEYDGLDRVAELAAFVCEHGALGAAIFHECDQNLDAARDAMIDRYLGCFASAADCMAETTEQQIAVPQPLAYYIDWEAMARDAAINGDIMSVRAGGAAHIFAGR